MLAHLLRAQRQHQGAHRLSATGDAREAGLQRPQRHGAVDPPRKRSGVQLALQVFKIVVLQLDESCAPGALVTQPPERCVRPATRLRLHHTRLRHAQVPFVSGSLQCGFVGGVIRLPCPGDGEQPD